MGTAKSFVRRLIYCMVKDRWLGEWGRRVNQSIHIKLVTSLLILVILIMLGICIILF